MHKPLLHTVTDSYEFLVVMQLPLDAEAAFNNEWLSRLWMQLLLVDEAAVSHYKAS